jgi:hypothetical protein
VRPIENGANIPDDIDLGVLEEWADGLELLRVDYDAAFDRVHDAQLRVNELTRSRDQLQNELQTVLAQIPDVQVTADTTRTQMIAVFARLEEYRAARDAATARLLGTDRLSGLVETTHPLLLLPVRLETRFMPARNGSGAELRVRIYPDDVHIDSHEPGLTEEEERWGTHFWQEAGDSDSDHSRRKQAWQQIVDRFGSPRAAWIARVLDPAAPGAMLRRSEAWTRASHTQVLADRWVAIAYREDRPVALVWGKPIPDTIVTGPSPSETDSGIDDPELPAIDDEMRWMIDFATAEAKGMALRIPLTEEQARFGFESLAVLGIKASIDAAATAGRLTDLLDAHHYTNGLAVAAQNAATNNTAEASSADGASESDGAGSYDIERGNPLVAPGSDGAVAAQALGVAAVVFAHLRHADGTEQHDAGAMNTALWGRLDSPLTRQLLAAVNPEFLRQHVIDFVRARGPLPALRVGSQPYGVLPVAAVDRWVTAAGAPDERSLADWWRTHRQAWRRQAANALSLARATDPTTLLGQEANACHYVLHTAQGDATTAPKPQSLVTGLLKDLLLNLAADGQPALAFLQALPDPIRHALIAEVLDLATYRFDAWATSLAQRRLTEVRRSNPAGVRLGGYGWVEDLRPGVALEEVSPLPANTSGPLYRSAANAGYVHAPSLTHAATAAVLRSGYLSDRTDAEGGESPLAVDLSSERVHRAKWLLDGVRQGQSLGALLGYRFERGLHDQGLDRFIHRFRTLASLKDEDALSKAYDTLRKAEAFAKDVSALYEQRDQAIQRVQDALALKAEREQRRQRYQNQLDGIQLLAQQADAAASEATDLGQRIARHQLTKPRSRVDARGRRYQVELIEEVDVAAWTGQLQQFSQARRAAQVLETTARDQFNARLGARLAALAEIARLDNRPPNPDSIAAAQQLVDAQTAIADELDRQAVAKEGTRGRAEQALAAARAELAAQLNRQWGQALESLAANNVVDGLELHRRWKAGQRRVAPATQWDATTIPFGDAVLGFPSLGSGDFVALDTQLRALDESVDAVGDVVVAESVYQIVQGNPLRSGATLDAIAAGEMPPPELEVVRTPRTGIALTHRLLALFPAAAGAAPPAWPVNALHVRAQAEPLLNAWAAALLPRPAQVRCRAAYLDQTSGAVLLQIEVPLTTLGLSPLDALYLAEGNEQAQRSELEQRLVFHLLRTRPASVPEAVDVRLSFAREPEWAGDVVSIGEFLEMARTMRALFGGARAIDGRDLSLPGTTTTSGLQADDLTRRADQAVKALERVRATLQTSLAAATTTAGEAAVDLEVVRQALLQMAHFGIQGSVPLSAVGANPDVRSALLTQARSVLKEVDGHLTRIAQLAATFDAVHAEPEARRDHDLARLAEVFGSDFRVMPQVIPADGAGLDQAFAASLALQGNDPMAAVSWFQRAAYVRDGVARLDAAMTYAEALGDGAALSLQVGQLPHQSPDRWVALAAAPGQSVPGGRLSLVAYSPLAEGLRFDRPLAGLIIDEWVEVVPSRQETTGLTFHYDQANSTAPQSILLAVSADQRPVWDLDSLESVLRQTMELARLRAAAPDVRAETIWVADDVPQGAALAGAGEDWLWVRLHPRPLFGKACHQSAVAAGMHQHSFQGATATLPISVGDWLFAYVYLDPVNRPRQVMLQWNDANWEHRAYWGENLIDAGTDGTVSRRLIGPLPPLGQWVRLEVPASVVGLEGRVGHGMAFTLWDGRATWGRAGSISREAVDAATTDRLAPALFVDDTAIDFSGVIDTGTE